MKKISKRRSRRGREEEEKEPGMMAFQNSGGRGRESEHL